ncbi:Dabb family protein [Nocardia cyriacigeorgica]|uniref:Dabb family protein n=1 Tax=Nocardia cyriacigeorgica TaxID=135487 RepID=UPI000559FE1E|nr:Dabb family protein [Nocardia cyriacigeorgica]AVH23991.1 Dabb family protein [Nocardia cyriacigeorgica]MBF6499631.1 Dabb family protein [Nocardia cyriacigeorgica]PPJ09053.1 Dabb family protein [Nocardia cyriacigeorgica]TLF54061.1 Dabb family protein [Nocardia cyriacigeorgica]
MSEVVHLIHLSDPGRAPELAAELRDLVGPRVPRSLITTTLPGGIDAGDLIVRLVFADDAGRRSVEIAVDRWLSGPLVERVETAAFTGGAKRETAAAAAGPGASATTADAPHQGPPPRSPARTAGTGRPARIYRALLVAVDPETDPAQVARFEAETAAMPDYIRTIGASQLSRVHSGTGWTHVWEQEFADLGGLTGPYMTHPYHWAHIDRWFDPERGTKIVTRLCHSFGALDAAALPPA